MALKTAQTKRRMRGAVRAGFTIIEILVVIILLAMLASSVAVGMRALPRARLRTSAMRMAGTMRFAYVHALTTGKSTRVVLGLGTARLEVEDTEDAHVLDPHDPLRNGGAEAVEQQAAAEAVLQTDLRPRASRASFTKLPDREFHARSLEGGVRVSRLYSQHEPEPREDGVGYVYFFSGGQTERAAVQLRNQYDDVFTIVLNPLTGRTEIFDRAVEPPVIDDRDTSIDREVDERERRPEESRP